MPSIKPSRNIVAIAGDREETKIGRIWIPDMAQKRTARGTVVGIGKEAKRILGVDVGSRVIWHDVTGDDFEIRGRTVTFVGWQHVLAELEES